MVWNTSLGTMVMSLGSAMGNRCGQCIHLSLVRIIQQHVLLLAKGLAGPDPIANVSQRIIPAEPLYVILNLGISNSFGKVKTSSSADGTSSSQLNNRRYLLNSHFPPL